MKVILLAALSIDGFIAQTTQQPSVTWTSPEDKDFFVKKTKSAGVVIFGNQTWQTIGRPLPGRLSIIYTHQTLADLLAAHHLSATEPPALAVTSQPPTALINQLAADGHQEVVIGGGASIYGQFLAADLVDELYLTIEPIIFGQGIKFLDQLIIKKFQLLDTTVLNQAGSLVLHYGRAV